MAPRVRLHLLNPRLTPGARLPASRLGDVWAKPLGPPDRRVSAVGPSGPPRAPPGTPPARASALPASPFPVLPKPRPRLSGSPLQAPRWSILLHPAADSPRIRPHLPTAPSAASHSPLDWELLHTSPSMNFFPFSLYWTLFPTLLIFNSRLTFFTFATNTNTRTHTIEGISWSCRFLHFFLLTQWRIHSLFLLILAPACVSFLQALLQFPKDALNLRFTCTGGLILRLHTLHFLSTAGHTNSSSQRGTTMGEGNRRWKRCQDFQWAIGRLEPDTLQLLQWDKKQLWIPCNGEVRLVLQFWLLVSLSMCVHAKLLSCVGSLQPYGP